MRFNFTRQAQLTLLVLAISMISPHHALSETVTLRCSYPTYSTEKGLHHDDNFNMIFLVDTEKGTAYIIGNQGSEEVTFIPNKFGGGYTFVEVTPSGNVMTTTIDTNMTTVHSRNTIMDGNLVPTQYYGTCEYK